MAKKTMQGGFKVSEVAKDEYARKMAKEAARPTPDAIKRLQKPAVAPPKMGKRK